MTGAQKNQEQEEPTALEQMAILLDEQASLAYRNIGIIERLYLSQDGAEVLDKEIGELARRLYKPLLFDAIRIICVLLEEDAPLGSINLTRAAELARESSREQLRTIIEEARSAATRLRHVYDARIARLDKDLHAQDNETLVAEQVFPKLQASKKEMLESLEHIERFINHLDPAHRSPSKERMQGNRSAKELLIRLLFARDYSEAEDEGVITRERSMRIRNSVE